MSNEKVVFLVANETVPALLQKAYDASMSATVRYRNLDAEMIKRGTQIKDVYGALVNQYKLAFIEVKPKSLADRQINLYIAHVERFFGKTWKDVKVQKKRVGGKVVKTRKADKGTPNVPTLTPERAEVLLANADCLKTILDGLTDLGYNVVAPR